MTTKCVVMCRGRVRRKPRRAEVLWKRKQIAIVPRGDGHAPLPPPTRSRSLSLLPFIFILFIHFPLLSLPFINFPSLPFRLPSLTCWRASPVRQHGFKREGDYPAHGVGVAPSPLPPLLPTGPPPLPPPFRFACPCVFFFVFLFCFSFAVTLFFFFSTSSFLNSRARGKVIQCRSVNNVVLMVLRIPFLRL